MKTGVVPIGSNAGGIKEVIKHGETGFVVDVGDSDAASEYAIQLLQDKALYNKLQKICLKILLNVLVQNSLQTNMSIIIKRCSMIKVKMKASNKMDKSLFEQAKPILEHIQKMALKHIM